MGSYASMETSESMNDDGARPSTDAMWFGDGDGEVGMMSDYDKYIVGHLLVSARRAPRSDPPSWEEQPQPNDQRSSLPVA